MDYFKIVWTLYFVSLVYSKLKKLASKLIISDQEVIDGNERTKGSNWYQEHPGPSLRGIIRGADGASGGLGVFTKCACHLHPWPGPPETEVKGNSPYYEAEIPSNFEYHVVGWPTWEHCADALYKVGSSGIGFAFHKTGGPGSHGTFVTGNNNEYYEGRLASKYLIPEVSWAFVSAGYTPEEHAYQVKVLERILKETGGSILPVGEDPTWKKRDYINMVKACFIPRMSFRITGTFSTDGMMGQESVDNCMLALKMDRSLRDKYVKKGVIVDDGTYGNWGVVYEGAHLALLEGGYSFSSIDENNMKEYGKMAQEGSEMALKLPIGMGWMAMGAAVKELGSRFGNLQNWIYKIKRTFDPNTVSDPMGHITGEDK